MKQNKEQLIKCACLGDAHALNQLLLVCQPDIRRFARRTCSTTEDVEDAVQFTLWQLHKKSVRWKLSLLLQVGYFEL